MKFKLDNKYFKWGLTAFSVIVLSLFSYYIVFHISELIANIKAIINIVMPVIFGLIIAYILTPIQNTLERSVLIPLFNKMKIKESVTRKKWIRAIAIILTSCIFFLSIYALFAMLISQIVPSLETIIHNFDMYFNNVVKWLNATLEDHAELRDFVLPKVTQIFGELETWFTNTSSEILTKSSEVLKSVSKSIFSFFKIAWNFILGYIIAVYLLISKEKFAAQSKKIIYAVFKTANANSVLKGFRFIHHTFIGFISGKVLDSIIIGLLCFIGTTLLGTPYAALVSLIVGVTNVIPFFGPYLGAIPSAFLILIVDLTHPMHCVTFLIFILILQQIDGNIIGPKILGDSTGLSSFWVIFAITVFGGLFGIPGMIVGVPIFAIIYAGIKTLVNRSLKKRKLPQDTSLYKEVDYIDKDGNFMEMEEEQERYEFSSKRQKQTRLFHKKDISDKNAEKNNSLSKEEPLTKDDTTQNEDNSASQ